MRYCINHQKNKTKNICVEKVFVRLSPTSNILERRYDPGKCVCRAWKRVLRAAALTVK